MKLLGVGLFAAALAAAPAFGQDSDGSGQDAGARQARIVQSSGTVYLHLQGQPDDAFIAAENGASLSPGDLVRTGTDGSAEIGLDGDSVIELGPGTDFVVNSLDPKATEFHLGLGTLIAKFRSLFQTEGMTIRTSNCVAAVRGTELGVESTSDDAPTHVGVFDEGKVAVQSEGSPGEVQLGPGQETAAKSGAPPAPAGPLKTLASRRQVIASARRNAASLKKSWVRQTPAQLAASRRRLAQKTPLRASQLRNVSPQMKARNYRNLQQRRQKLQRQQERRGQLQRRQERLEARQERKQANLEGKQERRQAMQEKRRQVRRQMAQRRAQNRQQRKDSQKQ